MPVLRIGEDGGDVGLFGASIDSLKRRGDVTALLDVFEAKGDRTAQRALVALGELDEASVAALSVELRGNNPVRAMAAAFALAAISSRDSMAAKLALLDAVRETQDPDVASAALDALQHEREGILHGLIDAVLVFLQGPACLLECPRDPAVFDDQPTRMTVKQMLGSNRYVNSEARTIQLLPAFKILGSTEAPQAIPLLARALSWEDPSLAAHEEELLANGLIEMGPRIFHKADERVRVAAAEALASKWDSAAVAPLVAALRDESKKVRLAAVNSLGSVCTWCDEDAPTALAALRQLVIVPDPRFPEDVDDPRDSLAESHAEVRAAACLQIAYLSHANNSAVLDELLASDNQLIRRAAAEGRERYRRETGLT